MGDVVGLTRDQIISIHAPREGGDRRKHTTMCCGVIFQSTPPARGATTEVSAMGSLLAISIHAPREGGDYVFAPGLPSFSDFNPRPPRGGRRPRRRKGLKLRNFNPRPPRGGRPDGETYWKDKNTISIHAPREGGDVIQPEPIYGANYFNPRPPRGGRRCILWPLCLPVWVFQSTPPARGATSRIPIVSNRIGYFNPRPPRGGRP